MGAETRPLDGRGCCSVGGPDVPSRPSRSAPTGQQRMQKQHHRSGRLVEHAPLQRLGRNAEDRQIIVTARDSSH